MTIFQQTLTRCTSQIRDKKVRAVLNKILTLGYELCGRSCTEQYFLIVIIHISREYVDCSEG